jgi:hypothetical protein
MAWVDAGLKVSEIQSKLAAELGLRLTYMELRFLLDDLKLRPRDVDVPKAPAAIGTPGAPGVPAAHAAPGAANAAPGAAAAAGPGDPMDGDAELLPEPAEPGAGAGGVSLTVDQLTRAGAVVSGKVGFSDGESADWYLDQYGRLGLAPKKQGYRPSQADVAQFQAALQDELAKLGF